MDHLIGKFAYKKYGFFSYLIGEIEKNNDGITPYRLVTQLGIPIPFNNINDIDLVDIDYDLFEVRKNI